MALEKLKRNRFPFSFLTSAFGPLSFAHPPAQLATGLSFLGTSLARFCSLAHHVAQRCKPPAHSLPRCIARPSKSLAQPLPQTRAPPSTADQPGPLVRLLPPLVVAESDTIHAVGGVRRCYNLRGAVTPKCFGPINSAHALLCLLSHLAPGFSLKQLQPHLARAPSPTTVVHRAPSHRRCFPLAHFGSGEIPVPFSLFLYLSSVELCP